MKPFISIFTVRATRLSWYCAFALGLSACGAEMSDRTHLVDSEQSQSKSRDVIGGTVSNDPTVVLYGCSATIIGPRTVVTAAHCFGSASRERTLQVGGRAVKARFLLHPRFNGYNFDVALGFTDEDLGVRPRAVGHSGRWGAMHMTGFGCNSTDLKTGYKTQRTGTATAERFVHNRRYFLDAMMVLVRSRSVGACPGDSGGAMIQGGRLLGVISRAEPSKRITMYTRITHNNHGIQQWMVAEANRAKRPICVLDAQGRALSAPGCQPRLAR